MAESTAGFRLVSITRRMIKQKTQSTDVADCVYGTVLSVAPLSVQLDTRTTLQEAQLVVGALCKETIIKIPFPEKGQIKHKHQAIHEGMHNTTMELPEIQLWRGLNTGDRVILQRFNNGQKYLILQRVEGIP